MDLQQVQQLIHAGDGLRQGSLPRRRVFVLHYSGYDSRHF
jgi:hypothetical protein